jgi:alpha-galactosidase
MNFWCIYRSPLMLGGNQPENRTIELKLFTNEEVIAVNQNGQTPRQLYKNDSSMVWISNVSSSKDFYVALFNIGENAHEVKVDFTLLGLKEKVMVRDLWKKENAGIFKKSYRQKINPHGSVMLRLSVQ